VTRISLLKQRSGPIGDFELLFRPAYSRFDDIQGATAEAPDGRRDG
jgi:replicative DNA helicase